MLYIIQRSDVSVFGAAKEIDPDYAKLLEKAINSGVEVIAIQAEVSPSSIVLAKEIPVKLG